MKYHLPRCGSGNYKMDVMTISGIERLLNRTVRKALSIFLLQTKCSLNNYLLGLL